VESVLGSREESRLESRRKVIVNVLLYLATGNCLMFRGADKSLARLGRKQVTETEDFDFHISYL